MPLTQDSLNGLEPKSAERGLALDCYLSAIRVLAHYAIDLEEELTGPYKKYLNALADDTEAGTPEALLESRGTLRGLLRDYRDKASAYLNQLRQELAETAGALQRILDILAQSEGDHEIHLRKALQTLRELARGAPDGSLLPALRETADTIEQSLAELGRSQQLTVSQFLVEIGLLHKRIDALEAAVSVDALTKLFNRAEIEQCLRSAETGSLLLLRVEGFGQATTHFSPEVAKELAGAFIKRLRNSVLPDSILGQWGEEKFAVIVPAPKEEALASAQWIGDHLSGAYACLQGGKTVRPRIQVHTEVLELALDRDADETLERVAQVFANDTQA
jgi:GGDEF domain-containing protein